MADDLGNPLDSWAKLDNLGGVDELMIGISYEDFDRLSKGEIIEIFRSNSPYPITISSEHLADTPDDGLLLENWL